MPRSLLRVAPLLALFAASLPLSAQTPAKPARPSAPAPAAAAPVPTVITGDHFEMWSTDTETRAYWLNNVVVTGDNLRLTCDKLDVTAIRFDDDKAKDSAIPTVDKFKTLVATGHVHIVQGDREATSDRADVFPGEDRVVLTGNVVITDHSGPYVATGDRVVLLRGERRITGDNIRGTFPPIKDLGAEAGKPAAPAVSLPSTRPAK